MQILIAISFYIYHSVTTESHIDDINFLHYTSVPFMFVISNLQPGINYLGKKGKKKKSISKLTMTTASTAMTKAKRPGKTVFGTYGRNVDHMTCKIHGEVQT